MTASFTRPSVLAEAVAASARRRWPARGRTLLVASSLAAALLAGCQSKSGTDGITTGAVASAAEIREATGAWAARYAQNPRDKSVVLNYAAALRRTGQAGQAISVLQRASNEIAGDTEVLSALGKALAANGDLEQALAVVRRANSGRRDWGLLSAEGAILDQLGKAPEARRVYTEALALAPREPSILSNLGMSYVLTDELPKAEETLRRAVALPNADSRVRQNLALVVGLQGRFDEAEQIAKQELTPEQAAANVAYLRTMLAGQNSWQTIQTAAATPR